MTRPARWLNDELTIAQALSLDAAPASSGRGNGATMTDVVRARLALAHDFDLSALMFRGGEVAHTAGLAAIAMTISVTMVLGQGASAKAATLSATLEDTAGERAPTASNSPARLPIDFDFNSRAHQRPSLQDQGTLTAALGPTETRGWSDVAARHRVTIITDFETATKIGPGFAKPKSLGRLAEDLPPKRPARGRDGGLRYAALGKPERSANKAVSASRLDGRISTSGHATACLPPDLRRVLNEVVANYGPIRINSTSRSHSHNRRVGGAPRSLHLECRAIDFAYHRSRRGKLISFLRNHWAVGGLGNYGSGGHIHIDDGPHRSW